MNKLSAMISRLLIAVLSFSVFTALAAPVTIDVASIDRERILQAASHALEQAPLTITSFHAKYSDGGPNDFYSNGDYWWPNPKTTNGLPYVELDGKTNPTNFIA